MLGIDFHGSAGASAAPCLQQLDGNVVRRAHEGHVAVARRPEDGHAVIGEALAGRVDVIDRVGQMAEIAAAAVAFRIPVVGELDLRRLDRPGAARNTSVKRPCG